MIDTLQTAITGNPGKLSSIDAQMQLGDLYANAAGIFNLRERHERPFHSIAMHDVEENGYNSELFDAIKLYRDNQVMKHFGLSWEQMKKLTHEEFTWIMELSAEATKKEITKNADTINNLENQLGKGQKK